MTFRHYGEEDYQAVCDFLIELNRERREHINWNWARFEWMMGHPEFDRDAEHAIGLWLVENRVVGAAVYDMYFGEAFCAALPGYEALYPEILAYAWKELKDDAGLGIAICDGNRREIAAAEEAGFAPAEQKETVMSMELTGDLSAELPEGYSVAELDPAEELTAFRWLLWQGFDHGQDRTEFEKTEQVLPWICPHFNRSLSLAAVDPDGEKAAYCCLWYSGGTDYAYVEPVCTVPACRGRGVARAILTEALRRAKEAGAKRAYVISDQAFYEKVGFAAEFRYSFYWKR